ncbi:41749_t:CDS:2, partial [Gigaspora margarita]
AAHLTHQMLYKIQQPFLKLVKNKIDLLCIVGNYVITYRNLVNCKLLWQELYTKKLINIMKELNSPGHGKEVLEIRIRQGFLLASYTNSKSFGVELLPQDTVQREEVMGTYIKNILGYRNYVRAAKKIESHLLKNEYSYEVKPEFKAASPNLLSLVPVKIKISEDNRKKEWIITEEGGTREVRQGKLSQENMQACIRQVKKNIVIGVLPRIISLKDKKELLCPILSFDSKDLMEQQIKSQREKRIVDQIDLSEYMEIEMIKNQHFEERLEETLIS